MKRVVYQRLAARELVDSAKFYEERRPMLGEEFLTEVEEVLTRIQWFPETGKPGKNDTRSYRVRRFPFRVIYQVHEDRIWIVALAHPRRKPGYWSRRTA